MAILAARCCLALNLLLVLRAEQIGNLDGTGSALVAVVRGRLVGRLCADHVLALLKSRPQKKQSAARQELHRGGLF